MQWYNVNTITSQPGSALPVLTRVKYCAILPHWLGQLTAPPASQSGRSCWAISGCEGEIILGRLWPGQGERGGDRRDQQQCVLPHHHSGSAHLGPGQTISLPLTQHHHHHHQEVKLSLKVNQPGRLNQFCHRTGPRPGWREEGREPIITS